MSSVLRKPTRMTFDEYLAFEAECRERHESRKELVGGYLFEMASECDAHYLITGNLYRELSRHSKKEHEVFEVEMKVGIQSLIGPFAYYPDIVVSGSPTKTTRRAACRTEPSLVVEVLSPSTERLDRGEKKLNYLQIPSLQEYVLVAQDKPKVEIMRRSTSWAVEELYPGDVLTLASVGLTLPLADIYRTITF